MMTWFMPWERRRKAYYCCLAMVSEKYMVTIVRYVRGLLENGGARFTDLMSTAPFREKFPGLELGSTKE